MMMQMLKAGGTDRGFKSASHDAQLMETFKKQIQNVSAWLADREHMDVLFVPFGGVTADPEAWAGRVAGFFSGVLQPELKTSLAAYSAGVRKTLPLENRKATRLMGVALTAGSCAVAATTAVSLASIVHAYTCNTELSETITIASGERKYALGGKIKLYNYVNDSLIKDGFNGTMFGYTIAQRYIQTYPAGVTCVAPSFNTNGIVKPGGDDRYIKIRFRDSVDLKYRYGWIQFRKMPDSFKFGAWCYNDTPDEAIKTVADVLSGVVLRLTGGGVQVRWSAADEAGIATYRVEKKVDGAAGEAWRPVAAEPASGGRYRVTCPGGKADAFRVVAVDINGGEAAFPLQ